MNGVNRFNIKINDGNIIVLKQFFKNKYLTF